MLQQEPQYSASSCSRLQRATDNFVKDGRSTWLPLPPRPLHGSSLWAPLAHGRARYKSRVQLVSAIRSWDLWNTWPPHCMCGHSENKFSWSKYVFFIIWWFRMFLFTVSLGIYNCSHLYITSLTKNSGNFSSRYFVYNRLINFNGFSRKITACWSERIVASCLSFEVTLAKLYLYIFTLRKRVNSVLWDNEKNCIVRC